MTIERIKPAMKNADIKKEAIKAGYKYTGYSNWRCDACEEEMWEAIQTIGYTGTTPPWADAHCALKFQKTGSTVVACRCGWRGNVTSKHVNIVKRHCLTEGCNVVLSKDDPFSTCWKCRTKSYEPTQNIKTCNRVNCTNPVPTGRTAVCYDCQPPAKEPASSRINM